MPLPLRLTDDEMLELELELRRPFYGWTLETQQNVFSVLQELQHLKEDEINFRDKVKELEEEVEDCNSHITDLEQRLNDNEIDF